MISFKEYLTEWSKTDPDIKTELISKGYKFLGRGVDQSAYLEPSTGKVLKIFGTQLNGTDKDGFSRDHKMFKTWADYCDVHSKNPFLPKFDGWESFKFRGHSYLQIRMEKLQKLPKALGNTLEAFSQKMKTSNISNAGRIEDIIGYIVNELGKHKNDPEDTGAPWDSSTNVFPTFTPAQYNELNSLAIFLGEKDFRLLLKTIAELTSIAKLRGWTLDLHGSNYMHRNDGIPVIVDPWVV